jgi:signal transduction histidine kinase
VILTALLGNASKFTSTHPSARIEVGALELEGEQVLFVRDDGVGLATVKRLVAWYGGRVWAESSVGRGAVFFFSLRARREECDLSHPGSTRL